MAEPRLEWTTFLITVFLLPGKYELETSEADTSFPGDSVGRTVLQLQLSGVPCQQQQLPQN